MKPLSVRRLSVACCIAAACLCPALPLQAQSDLENVLEQYGEGTIKGYIQPLADLFGANMHAGYYHSASIGRLKPTVKVSIIAMASAVSDNQKTYIAPAPNGFVPETFETATLFGKKGQEIRHAENPQLKYKGSDGIVDAAFFPLAVAQIAVGYLGNEAIIRYFKSPSLADDAFPETTLLGLGLRHNISQYLPLFPIDVAVGGFYNSFTMGEIIDFKGLALGAQASKGLGPLSAYGGLAWEKSTMSLKYSTKDPYSPARVNIDLEGDNRFRLTVGSRFSFGLLSIFADLNMGSVTNFSGGVALGI